MEQLRWRRHQLAMLYEKQGNTSPTREGKEKKPLRVNAGVSTGNPAAVFLPRRPLRANERWGWGRGRLGRCSKPGKAHGSAGQGSSSARDPPPAYAGLHGGHRGSPGLYGGDANDAQRPRGQSSGARRSERRQRFICRSRRLVQWFPCQGLEQGAEHGSLFRKQICRALLLCSSRPRSKVLILLPVPERAGDLRPAWPSGSVCLGGQRHHLRTARSQGFLQRAC